MTHPTLHETVLSLPFPERVELAQELWASVHADAAAAPFAPEQLAEIDRRIAALDSGDELCEPWETVQRRIQSGRR